MNLLGRHDKRPCDEMCQLTVGGFAALVVRRASYSQAQHLNGSVMGHQLKRCNADNEAWYTGPQERSRGMVTLDARRLAFFRC